MVLKSLMAGKNNLPTPSILSAATDWVAVFLLCITYNLYHFLRFHSIVPSPILPTADRENSER